MGYMHIENLYKNQDILMFMECYVLEKVHGTSAHVGFRDGKVFYFNGGETRDKFVGLFSGLELRERFEQLGLPNVTVFGEAYGGKQQGMRETYGDDLRFIVFDVRVDDVWLDVPDMADVATKLGLEVVPWCRMPTTITGLDAMRDAPSEVAQRRGCGNKPREGIVIRPLQELTKKNGQRIIVKHKGAAFSERLHTPKVIDADKLEVLQKAEAIAREWVTPMRLEHVLQKIDPPHDMSATPKVINAMVEDVYREAKGEIVESKEARQAICRMAAGLYKRKVMSI